MYVIWFSGMVELGWRLEWMMLEVFSKLSDFVILLCELQRLRVANTPWSCSDLGKSPFLC